MGNDDSARESDAGLPAVKPEAQPDAPTPDAPAPDWLFALTPRTVSERLLTTPLPQVLDFATGDPLKRNLSADFSLLTPLAVPSPPLPYTGEKMGFALPAREHKVAASETLPSIARKALGVHATKENIERYVTEIQHTNGLSGDKAPRGRTIALPGHSADGAFIVFKGGVTATTWASGVQQYEYKDGRKFSRTPGAGGSYTEQHSGPRPEDNFAVVRGVDGKITVSEKLGGVSLDPTDNSDVRVAQAKLHDAAFRKITDPAEKAKFEADIVRFEARARLRGLDSKEVAETFTEIRRMLETKVAAVTAEQVIQLAQQTMSQAADPRIIDQGDKNTCTVTHVQGLVFTTDPAKAAGLVRQIALSGRYKDDDGTIVRLDAQSLRPDHEAKHHPPLDGERSFLTQLFNVTAVNLAYRRLGIPHRYEQHAPDRSDPDDSGERLFRTTGKQRKLLEKKPGLDDDQVVEAYRGITGRKDGTVLLEHESYVVGPGKKIDTISSQQDFIDKLTKLKADGKLPVMIGVNSAVEPFYTDSGGGEAGGSGGGHVVTVTDFIAGPPSMVAVDNSWGSSSDKRSTNLSVSDLYITMLDTAEAANALKSVVVENRANKTVDMFKEFDLLRLQREAETITDKQYGIGLAEQLDAGNKLFDQQRSDKTFKQHDQDSATKKLNELRDNLTPLQSLSFTLEASKRGTFSSKQTADQLVETMSAMLNQRDQLIEDDKYKGAKRSMLQETQRDFLAYVRTLPAPERRDILKRIKKERDVAFLDVPNLPRHAEATDATDAKGVGGARRKPVETPLAQPSRPTETADANGPPSSGETTDATEQELDRLFQETFAEKQGPALPKPPTLQIKDVGDVASLTLPPGWVKVPGRNDATGYSFGFRPAAESQASFNLMYRGRPLEDTAAATLSELLHKPAGYQLSPQDIEGVRTLLGGKADPSVFRINSAAIAMLNGRPILAVKGNYKDQPVSALHVYTDTGKDGRVVQELAFVAPQTQYNRLWKEAERTLRSIKWR